MEFRISSQELEAELEKDAEIAEGKERIWREKAEGLGFEVEEWKVCRDLISYTLDSPWANIICSDQTQASKGRGKHCTKYVTEGNNDTSRHE